MLNRIRPYFWQAAVSMAFSLFVGLSPAWGWERGGEEVSAGEHRSQNMNENLQLEAAGEMARQRTEQMVGETHPRHGEHGAESRAGREGLYESTAYPAYTSTATVTEADLPPAGEEAAPAKTETPTIEPESNGTETP